MLKGVFYTAISKYSGVIITIIIGAILARLLTPAEFGTVALVTVFTNFLSLLGNMGIGPAVIQRKDLNEKDLSVIFIFSVLVAGLLSILFFFSGRLISRFYDEPELVLIVRILSISVFFNLITIVPSAINRKKLLFKEMGIISVSVQIIAGAITIWMAFSDFGYYALVYKSIIAGVLSFFIYFYLYPIKITSRIDLGPLKKIASFSSYQFAFNFVNYFSRNLDNILIGKFMGNTELGFYNKSYNLMLLPVNNLTHVLGPVLHPYLSKFQDDKERLNFYYLKTVKLLSLIGFPISVFLYFAAPELIMVLYGPQWTESIPVFQVLAFSVGLQICLSSSGGIFQAANRTDLLFISGLLSSFIMVSGICYGVFIGETLVDVGYGLLIAFALNFIQGFYILQRFVLRSPFLNFLKIFIKPILFSFFLAAILIFIEMLEVKTLIFSLMSKVVAFAGVMLTAFYSSKDFRQILQSVFSKLKPKNNPR